MARKSRINKQFNTTNNNTIYNVAFYIRISVEDEENNSIENQQTLLENYIKHKDNFKLVDTYIDTNKTGTNFNRNGFENLLDDVKKRENKLYNSKRFITFWKKLY